jgi:HSF-type DNA-binding
MCISNKRRPARPTSSSNADASLISLLNRKTNNNSIVVDMGYSSSAFDMSALEPTPMAEPASSSSASSSSSSSTSSSAPRQPQHLDCQAPTSSHAHIIIQHHYNDHSTDARSNYQEQHPARGGVVTPFPLKLHEMLSTVASTGEDSIVSWQPHGRCFVVHDPKAFVALLPGYFKLSKLASFQRQLNLYGFQRLTRGRDKGGYYHELFLRGRVFLSHSIQRVKVKGTGVRARSNPDQEPNFWNMTWLEEEAAASSNSESIVPAAASCIPSSSSMMMYNYNLPLQFSAEPQMLAAPWNTQEDDELFSAFDAQPFQFVSSQEQQQQQGLDALLASEAEAFFDDFEFPQDITDEIESDDVFGNMLEQMIA